RHTRFSRDWSSDVCSSDLGDIDVAAVGQSLRQQLTGAAAAAVELAEYFVGDSGIGGRGPVQANAVGSGGAHCEAGNGCRFLAQRSEERRVGKCVRNAVRSE